MNNLRLILNIALVLLSVFSLHAQDTVKSRPVMSVYALEAGTLSAKDTYLSPIRYSGPSLGITGNWQKAFTTRPQLFSMEFDAAVRGARMLNPVKNSIMMEAGFGFAWGTFARFSPLRGLQLAGGVGVDIDASVLYLIRNGNNPVDVKAGVSLFLGAKASYVFNIGRLPVRVSDNVSLPSLGTFFSPEYGETYYEIYLGNRSGLAHAAWWGNRFRLDNLLAVELDFGRTAMQIGYRFSSHWSHVNSLYTDINRHSFVIGVIPGGLGLKKKRKAAETVEIINPLYSRP